MGTRVANAAVKALHGEPHASSRFWMAVFSVERLRQIGKLYFYRPETGRGKSRLHQQVPYRPDPPEALLAGTVCVTLICGW
jgi:hypothetical protein